jgi:hypothetical protein
MVYKSYIFISKVGYRSYLLSSASWNICTVFFLPRGQSIGLWSPLIILTSCRSLVNMLTLRYKLHGKEKPHERDNSEPRTTNTQPSTPPPPPKPNKAYTGISICPQPSQCPYKPVQGFFAVQTLCPRPVPYSSIY